MPKLPLVKPRQVITVLEKAGFVQVRQRGSHLRLKRGNLSVTVPIHPGDLPQAVLRSILRQAHMTPEEFLERL
ncbi:MAG: type II toxin-antitoxin system HicA family toxin [Anaerolineae bacterium]|nr:type II toxin-antitoxin system HicA family toxin [Anaerolineae bacterium]